MAPLLPIGPRKAHAIRLGGATLGSPVQGDKKRDPSKNREMHQALALGGRPFIGQHNNQPRVGFCNKLDWRGGVVGGERVGVRHPIDWGASNGGTKIINKTNTSAIRWPLIDDAAHNNQPKTHGCNGAGIQDEV